MFLFRTRVVADPATQLNFEQLSMALPKVGTVIVTMPALAANGVAVAAASVPLGGLVPRYVLATPTDTGTIFFSNQYLIGTYGYIANGFSIEVGSNGFAVGAGWTFGINYIAYFQ